MAKTPKFGRVETTVMHLLASCGPLTVAGLVSNWPGLTDSGVRAAVDRLGRRGLVDLADRHHESGRVFRLTANGALAEEALLEDAEG